MTDARKCFRCGAPAPTYVDWHPLHVVHRRRFWCCWPCSDALAAMTTAEREAEFERAR